MHKLVIGVLVCGLALLSCSKKHEQRRGKKALTAVKTKVLKPRVPKGTTLQIENTTKRPTTVYVSFGSDSAVTQADWATFCPSIGRDCTAAGTICMPSRYNCSFPMRSTYSMPLLLGGKYLNATFSFGQPVGCGSTKAELNLNNPKWFDTYDVSLVDGYSNKIRIDLFEPGLSDKVPFISATAGPPNGATGNWEVYGVFPLGCDICTASKNPPCGGERSRGDCKTGTQDKPDVPCQIQGKKMGGGDAHLRIRLVPQ